MSGVAILVWGCIGTALLSLGIIGLINQVRRWRARDKDEKAK